MKNIKGIYEALDIGDARYRDDYGNWFPLLTKEALKELIKKDKDIKIVGDTTLNKASKKCGIVIKGVRYNVSRKNHLNKCLGYIACDNGTIIRLTKSMEWPKILLSAIAIAIIGFTGFKYVNSNGTLEMMLNKVTSKSDFRDNFNYSDQTVSYDSYIEIGNNTYNPVTLQYIVYNNGIKVYDTGELKPGDSTNFIYRVYFNKGTYNLKCETIAKSLDGLNIISDNTKDFKLTVK